MKVLLDTVAFLFAANDDARLSSAAREIVRDADNSVYLSAVSAWEIGVKCALGKLLLPEPPDRYIPRIRDGMGIDRLPLMEEAALRVGLLPPVHRDPFDRMLISQAISQGMTLLTPDEDVRRYPVPTMW